MVATLEMLSGRSTKEYAMEAEASPPIRMLRPRQLAWATDDREAVVAM